MQELEQVLVLDLGSVQELEQVLEQVLVLDLWENDGSGHVRTTTWWCSMKQIRR